MRLRTRIGLALLLVGCGLLLVSSGAFDSIDADRGVSLDVANDSEALLNISYPNGQPINLSASDADNYISTFDTCGPLADCEYSDIAVLVLSDNTARNELEVTGDIQFGTRSDSNLTIMGDLFEDPSGSGLTTVRASLECEEDSSLFGSQYHGSGWIEMDLSVTDGNMTIDATRRVNVNCIGA